MRATDSWTRRAPWASSPVADMALDLVVSGATGRMGQALARLIDDAEDLRVLGGIARHSPVHGPAASAYPEIVPAPQAGELLGRADVIIDFSAPAQVVELLDECASALEGRALVVGTTGLDQHTLQRLDALAAAAPVLVAANFSIGVNLLIGMVEQATRALPADRYDIEIVETHHRRKEDAPSGTALALGQAAARGRDSDLQEHRTDGRTGRPGARPTGEIGIHAVRGGGVHGEHTVHLLGERERISLGHSALTRDLFAEGALLAARWVATRDPGRYSMADVLGY